MLQSLRLLLVLLLQVPRPQGAAEAAHAAAAPSSQRTALAWLRSRSSPNASARSWPFGPAAPLRAAELWPEHAAAADAWLEALLLCSTRGALADAAFASFAGAAVVGLLEQPLLVLPRPLADATAYWLASYVFAASPLDEAALKQRINLLYQAAPLGPGERGPLPRNVPAGTALYGALGRLERSSAAVLSVAADGALGAASDCCAMAGSGGADADLRILIVDAHWYVGHSSHRITRPLLDVLLRTARPVVCETPSVLRAVLAAQCPPRHSVALFVLDRTSPASAPPRPPDKSSLPKGAVFLVRAAQASAGELRAVAANVRATGNDIVLFPSVGMTSADLYLSNVRLAPVQVALYGHPSSTHGALIDVWLGGWQGEASGGRSTSVLRPPLWRLLPSQTHVLPDAIVAYGSGRGTAVPASTVRGIGSGLSERLAALVTGEINDEANEPFAPSIDIEVRDRLPVVAFCDNNGDAMRNGLAPPCELIDGARFIMLVTGAAVRRVLIDGSFGPVLQRYPSDPAAEVLLSLFSLPPAYVAGSAARPAAARLYSVLAAAQARYSELLVLRAGLGALFYRGDALVQPDVPPEGAMPPRPVPTRRLDSGVGTRRRPVVVALPAAAAKLDAAHLRRVARAIFVAQSAHSERWLASRGAGGPPPNATSAIEVDRLLDADAAASMRETLEALLSPDAASTGAADSPPRALEGCLAVTLPPDAAALERRGVPLLRRLHVRVIALATLGDDALDAAASLALKAVLLEAFSGAVDADSPAASFATLTVRLFPRSSMAAYVAELESADVVLDSFPWAGGNSVYDALHAGVPVVTLQHDGPKCPGSATTGTGTTPLLWRSAVASVMLTRLGLTGLVALHAEDFVNKAAWVVANARLREQWRRALLQAPLDLALSDPREGRDLPLLLHALAAARAAGGCGWARALQAPDDPLAPAGCEDEHGAVTDERLRGVLRLGIGPGPSVEGAWVGEAGRRGN